MVWISIEQVRELLSKPENISNAIIVASIKHEKSTITDSLAQKAGITNYVLQSMLHKDLNEDSLTSPPMSLYIMRVVSLKKTKMMLILSILSILWTMSTFYLKPQLLSGSPMAFSSLLTILRASVCKLMLYCMQLWMKKSDQF